MNSRPLWLALGGLWIAALTVSAQPPEDGRGTAGADDLVTRMMAFDKDRDGTLARAEVTDARLRRLFARADADKDGTVTKRELTALAEKEQANDRNRPPGFGPPGPPPGGFMMGPPRPGEILPPMLRQRLKLSQEQQAQLSELQKEVDGKLEKILNDEQKAELKALRERGPGGFGPPGRRRPGPGGGPPPRFSP